MRKYQLSPEAKRRAADKRHAKVTNWRTQGLCIGCGGQREDEAFVRCTPCRIRSAKGSKRDAEARKAAGLCSGCNTPVTEGKKCARCREKGREAAARFCIALKELVVAKYGGCCVECGESDIVFLTVSRLEAGSHQFRKQLGSRYANGKNYYRWLRDQGFPGGHAILCYNHSMIRRFANLSDGRHARKFRKMKPRIIAHYGGKCTCCGITELDFLTLDHIAGDGAAHRKEIGASALYRWVIQNDFPSNVQVLCWNCNGAKRDGKLCPHQARRLMAESAPPT